MTHHTKIRSTYLACALCCAAAFALAPPADAGVVAEFRGHNERPASTTQSFPLVVSDVQSEYGISVTAILNGGSGSLRVIDPAGNEIYQHLWSSHRSQQRARLHVGAPGPYTMEVKLTDATGAWRARIVGLPPRGALKTMYVSVVFGIVLALAALNYIRTKPGARVAVIAGGAMFGLGSVIWFIGAILLHILVFFDRLDDALPYMGFLWTQSAVLGIWQGLAATCAVWAVARAFKVHQGTYANAFCAGLAGGAFEMLLIGVGSLLGLLITFGTGAKSDSAAFNLAYSMAVTPGLPLVDPAIQVCGVICRTGATALILLGMRNLHRANIVTGAFVFAAILTAASSARSLELLGPESRWLVLSVSGVVALLAIWMLRQVRAQWPPEQREAETPLDTFLRDHEAPEISE